MQMSLQYLSCAGLSSVDSVLNFEGLPILPDHARFFPTETPHT
jgi:hypothetical protein